MLCISKQLQRCCVPCPREFIRFQSSSFSSRCVTRRGRATQHAVKERMVSVLAQIINDRISGTPNLCCLADRLVSSLAIWKCSGNEKRAKRMSAGFWFDPCSSYIAHSPCHGTFLTRRGRLICLTFYAYHFVSA